MKKVYIYGLEDPRTNKIRYVGQSYKPKERHRQHIKGSKTNGHKENRIGELREMGLSPKMVIFEETTEENWDARERYWIKFGLDSGWPLTNIAAGGACYPAPIYKEYGSSILDPFLSFEDCQIYHAMAEETQLALCEAVAYKMIDFEIEQIRTCYNRDVSLVSQLGCDVAHQLIFEAD